jgi:hypothetical protein
MYDAVAIVTGKGYPETGEESGCTILPENTHQVVFNQGHKLNGCE